MHLTLPWIFPQKRTWSAEAAGWTALTVSILAGSTSTSFAKQLSSALSPLSMLFISEFLILAFTALSFGLVPMLLRIRKLPPRTLAMLAAVGLCNSVAAPLLVFTGIQTTGAISAEFFLRSQEFLLLLLAGLVLRETLTGVHLLSGVLIFAGTAVTAMRGLPDGLALQRGDILILLGCFLYACGGITFKKHLSHLEPELVIFARTCTALSVFFVLSPFMHRSFADEIAALPGALLPALIGYGFIARFLSLFCFYESIERLTVRTVSLLSPLGIITSVLFAAWYLDVEITGFHVVGGGLILAGSMVLNAQGLFPRHAHAVEHMKHQQRQHV